MECRMPPNYSWVVDGLLAALAYPHDPAHIQYMIQQGIKTVFPLTEKVPPSLKQPPVPDLKIVHIAIVDFTPPSIEQVEQFVEIVDRAKDMKEAVAVHCAHGRGRTGTMIACYLVKSFGYQANRAIQEIRRLRPGSIETSDQEELVHKYECLISKCKNNNNQ